MLSGIAYTPAESPASPKSETSLNYNVNPHYSPSTGTYNQSDPIGLQGEVNTYAYVGRNPANLVDPLGLHPHDWDGEIPDTNYGGYTQNDEDDALDLSNNIPDDISCELVEEMINVLWNRIRGRQIDMKKPGYGGGDPGHKKRVDNLIDAHDRFVKARECCK